MPAAGSYWINLGLLGAGGSISLDGTQIARTGFINGTAPRYGVLRPGDNSVLPTTDGLDNLRTQLNLTAGPHTLTVTVAADVSGAPVQVRLNWVTPAQQQANTTRPSPRPGTPRPRWSSPGPPGRWPPRCPRARTSSSPTSRRSTRTRSWC